jgi:hypothetical protein
MSFILDAYIQRLKLANIPYEKSGTGQYKGDYYVAAGSFTPHIHLASNGTFAGLKGKRGAITTLVQNREFKIEAIQDAIDELKTSLIGNELTVKNALLELARQYKWDA